ncbi:MAG TPA: MDR family MFS transporter [Enterovirga sp.]|nr:MDR family MFS transporter [Enterovirga sp.]
MQADPRTRRPFVIASIMAAMFMIAIEATIVSTAMPQIVGQLGGLHLYSWVFSAFLLGQTATTVIFGKLSDVYGRRPVLLAGIAVFLIGSVLCGFAWSMPSMVLFRLIQGIGAGAVQPVALTVVGDLYSAHERGRVQGFLASVWAVSAVIGPLAGGLIIQNLSWAWIFWVNLPIGVAAAAGFILFLHEGDARERRPVDLAGAALFAVAVASLMIALTEIGTSGAGTALPAALVLIVSLVLFVLQERRAPEPMIALGLWGRRPIAAANGAALLAGMALIGLTSFLPMYVQGVMNRSPLVAGFALTMMVLGWPIGATLSARSFGRFGLRRILLAGSCLMPLGSLAFLSLTPDAPPAIAGLGSLVMGFGMGLLSTSSIVLIQEIVAWSERGSATASNVFARNLGSTLGATVLGAVLNYGLAHSGRTGATVVTSEELRRLLESSGGTVADSAVRAALQQSLHLTFWAVFAISLGIVLLAFVVPPVELGRPREAPAE